MQKQLDISINCNPLNCKSTWCE